MHARHHGPDLGSQIFAQTRIHVHTWILDPGSTPRPGSCHPRQAAAAGRHRWREKSSGGGTSTEVGAARVGRARHSVRSMLTSGVCRAQRPQHAHECEQSPTQQTRPQAKWVADSRGGDGVLCRGQEGKQTHSRGEGKQGTHSRGEGYQGTRLKKHHSIRELVEFGHALEMSNSILEGTYPGRTPGARHLRNRPGLLLPPVLPEYACVAVSLSNDHC